MSQSHPTVLDLDVQASWPPVTIRRRREHRHERITMVLTFAIAATVMAVAGAWALSGLFTAGVGYGFCDWLKWNDIYGRP